MSVTMGGLRARHRARTLVATGALVGSLLAPVAALVTAGPAAACGVECSGTVTASTSNARVGSTAHITVHSGIGEDQCFELTANPSSGASLGDSSTPADAATPSSGDLTWPVSNSQPGTVTYTVFYRGPTFSGSGNGCPDSLGHPGADPDSPLQSTAQITWLNVGPEQNSTLTAVPNIVVGDAQSSSTVTVVLTDANGNAITGEQVRLTGLPGAAEVRPVTVTSGGGGQAVFTVSSATATSPGSVGAQRFDGSGWIDLDAHDSLQFVGPAQAERAFSSVDASLLRVPADGLSTTTLTVTLKDGSGPLAGRPVQIFTGAGTPTVIPLASQTDAAGQISFTASDSSQEQVTFTATDTASGLAAGRVTVRYGPAPFGEQGKYASVLSLSPSGDVVVAATLPNDGTTAAAVYVQLTCIDLPADGCNAAGIAMYPPNMDRAIGTIWGAKVKLVPTSSTSAVVTQVLDPTNYNGEARFQVTDTVPETVTFNAFDATNNVQLASIDDSTSPPLVTPLKVTLTFVGPGTPSATTSTATASPASVAADGATPSTITVTLKDANHLLVPGKTVTLNPSGSATFTPAQAVTDRNGVVTFATVDTHAETVSYLVQDVTDTIALTTFPQVSFLAGAPSGATSTVSASPTTLAADGTSTSTITVTITDANGGPVSGKTVSLQGTGHSTINGPSGATNANGVTTFTVRDGTPEAVTYTATDVTDGFDLTHTATVTFTGNPTSAKSTISADPTSVPANSIATSTVTVTLGDQNGNPVAGKRVTLRKANGGQEAINPVTPGSDTSNQSGVATFSLTDGVPETVTVSAFDATDNIGLSATTTVTFTGPPSGSTSTVTANPTTAPADGNTASTVTVTVRDGSGQPVPGHTITLAGSSGTHSNIASVINPTNASGVATFTVTDATAETVTYSATDVTVNPNLKVFATAQVAFGAVAGISSISPNSGPYTGGTKVTITGTSLSAATGVLFGTTAGTGLSVNKKNGSLTVTSPPGSGTVDIHVVFQGGSQTPSVPADQFRYAPQVTGVSPTTGTHNGGTKVTISGTNFTGVPATGAVKFGNTVATYTVNKNGTITATAPPGTAGASVDVTVTSPGGTSAMSPADKFTYS